jgi:hypothetical protein
MYGDKRWLENKMVQSIGNRGGGFVEDFVAGCVIVAIVSFICMVLGALIFK